MKIISRIVLISYSPEAEVQAVKDFRLNIAETLLASTTFNGKMNALKEVYCPFRCLLSDLQPVADSSNMLGCI